MKHNSMSPFVSKLAGERGLFYMHVVASTLPRGFVQQIMAGRSRWSREKLTSNGSANQPSKWEQEDYNRHSHLQFLPMLHLRKWENCKAKENKWPWVLTSPRKRACAPRSAVVCMIKWRHLFFSCRQITKSIRNLIPKRCLPIILQDW